MPSLLRTPTGQAISEYIQTLIFEGELPPGSRIDREQIAREVGTSQIPVREALLRLEAEGAIVIEPHRGAFVAPTSKETVTEHWELVGLINGLVAAKVARRRDPEVLAEFKALVAEMQTIDEPDAFLDISLRVSRLLNYNGATAKLRKLLRQFGRQVPGNFYARIPGSMDEARARYKRILKAVQAGDPDAARQAALTYMRKQGALVLAVLQENGVLTPEVDANGADSRPGAPA